MPANEPITAGEVKRRAALAGVTFDDECIDEVVKAMALTLDALRGLDRRMLHMVEPVVTFDPAGGPQERGR